MAVNVPVDCCIFTMEWSGKSNAIVVAILVVIVVYHCDAAVRLG